MQTLKQVLNRPSEREHLRTIAACVLSVCGFVGLSFGLLILHALFSGP